MRKKSLLILHLVLFIAAFGHTQTPTFTPTQTPTPFPVESNLIGPNAFFVNSPEGSDSNDGSWGNPWLTIDHAIANTNPGDTIFVRAGSYGAFTISSGQGGSAVGGYKKIVYLRHNHTTFSAEEQTRPYYSHINFNTEYTPSGADQTQSPNANNAVFPRITLNGADYVQLKGLEISGDWTNGGIFIESSVNNVWIEKCLIHHSYRGINGGGSAPNADTITVKNNRIFRTGFPIVSSGFNWLIEGNHIDHALRTRTDTHSIIAGDTDHMRILSATTTVRYNHIGPSWQREQKGTPHIDGIQGFVTNNWHKPYDILIERNYITHEGANNSDSFLKMILFEDNNDDDTATRITARNNFFYGAGQSTGVVIGVDYFYGINNTFYKTSQKNWQGSYTHRSDIDHSVIVNNHYIDSNPSEDTVTNIIRQNNFGDIGIDNNYVTFPTGDIDGSDGHWNISPNNEFTIASSGSIISGGVDPRSLSAGWLVDDNWGTLSTWTEDFYQTQRPAGTWEIGFMESTADLPTPTPSATNTPFPTSTPTATNTATFTPTATFTTVPTSATVDLAISRASERNGVLSLVVGDSYIFDVTVTNEGGIAISDVIAAHLLFDAGGEEIGGATDKGGLALSATSILSTSSVAIPEPATSEQVVVARINSPAGEIDNGNSEYRFAVSVYTPTGTPSPTPTPTSTNTPTFTPTATGTNTPTHTPTFTPTHTPTFTPSPTTIPARITHLASQPVQRIKVGFGSVHVLYADYVLSITKAFSDIPNTVSAEVFMEKDLFPETAGVQSSTMVIPFARGDIIQVNDATQMYFHDGLKWIGVPWEDREYYIAVGDISIVTKDVVLQSARKRIRYTTITVPASEPSVTFADKKAYTYFVQNSTSQEHILENPFKSRAVLTDIRMASPPYSRVLATISHPATDKIRVYMNKVQPPRAFILSLIRADLTATIGHATDTVVQHQFKGLNSDYNIRQFVENGSFYRKSIVSNSLAGEILTVTTASPLGPDAMRVNLLKTPFWWNFPQPQFDQEHGQNSRDFILSFETQIGGLESLISANYVKHDILNVSATSSALRMHTWDIELDTLPFDGVVNSASELEFEDGRLTNAQ